MTRAFVAVPVAAPVAAELSTQLDVWRPRLPLRWTEPGVWHLTMQFLGDWPTARLESLAGALEGACDQEPFDLIPGVVGAFPDLRRPRVLFLQLDDQGPAARLAASVRSIVQETWPDGPQDRRPFRPHLTLARVRSKLSKAQANTLSIMKLEDLPTWSVTGFRLLASDLRPDGPRHRTLASLGLRKKGE